MKKRACCDIEEKITAKAYLFIKNIIFGSSHLFLHDAGFLFLYDMAVTGKKSIKQITGVSRRLYPLALSRSDF